MPGSTPFPSGDAFVSITAPGDSLLYVSTNANKIYVIRLSTGAAVDSIAIPSPAIFFVARGDSLYASLTFSGTVLEISFVTRAVLRTLTVGGKPQGILISPNGAELYAVDEGGLLRIHSLATNSSLGSVQLPGGGGSAIARNPVNGLLYVTTAFFGTGIHVINAGSRTVVKSIDVGGDPRRIAFTSSGSIGIVANQSGWVDFIR